MSSWKEKFTKKTDHPEEKNEENSTENSNDISANDAHLSKEEFEKLKMENETLQKRVQDLSYALSDRENNIKFLKQDFQMEEFRILQRFIKAIYGSIDDLIRILANQQNEAIQMSLGKLLNSFKSFGIEIITPKQGDEFDSTIHNAISQSKNETLKSNQIDIAMSNCYKVKDNVIVHAMVSVVDND